MIVRHYLHTDPAVAILYLFGCGGRATGAVLEACGRGLNGTSVTTIGFERRHNRAFSVTDGDELVALMLRDILPRPPRADDVRNVDGQTTPAVRGGATA